MRRLKALKKQGSGSEADQQRARQHSLQIQGRQNPRRISKEEIRLQITLYLLARSRHRFRPHGSRQSLVLKQILRKVVYLFISVLVN